MKNNQRGSALLVLLIAVALVLAGVYFLYMRGDEVRSPASYLSKVKETVRMLKPDSDDEFEELDEPEGTPEEASNKAIEEMDELIKEIDDSSSGEDFSDLTN